MADPVTMGAVITGLVALMKEWLSYDLDKRKADKEGEEAATIIRESVARHGDEKDRKALANFEEEPQDYAGALESKLTRLSETNEAFRAQIQHRTDEAVRTGSIVIQGNARIYGPVVETNTDDIHYEYRGGQDD